MKLFLCFIFLVSLVNAQSNPVRDGNWWLKLNEGQQYNYMLGSLDGMDLGVYFLYLNLSNTTSNNVIKKDIINNYNINKKKYFRNLSYKQLIGELSSFYENDEYLDIKLRGAVYLMLLKLSGASKIEIENKISFFKKIKPIK